jgi:ubiquinone/menaquinone biosynthesis C-methylase UbiE/choline kinase
MRAIILAAGRPAFGAEPVSHIDIHGERLLDIQVSVLRKAGIEDITVVTGYGHGRVVRTDIGVRWNREWEATGSVSSLRCCSDLFDGREDVLVLYGDTLFEPWVIEALLAGDAGIAVACHLDRSNRDLGRFREYAKLSGSALTAVSPEAYDHGVRTVFTGLLAVRRGRAAVVRSHLDDAAAGEHVGRLVDRMVRRGVTVVPVVVERGWVELTSQSLYEDALARSLVLETVIQIHTDWSARAWSYDRLQWVNDDHLLAAMLEVAKAGDPRRVLDIGTGSGKVLLGLRGVLGAGEFWGVDTSQAMLDRIPDRRGLNLKLSDAQTLAGIPDGHFDLATARMVFHHIPDAGAAMRSITRVLRPGGRLVICEGVPPSSRTVKWYTDMFRYKEDRRTLAEGDIIHLFVRGGFHDVATTTITMKRASLNNWLDNSGIPQRNIDLIKELHYNAPAEVIEDYGMEFTGGDCLMTWRFAVVSGTRP